MTERPVTIPALEWRLRGSIARIGRFAPAFRTHSRWAERDSRRYRVARETSTQTA
jgi:hypothetical protein